MRYVYPAARLTHDGNYNTETNTKNTSTEQGRLTFDRSMDENQRGTLPVGPKVKG